MLQKCICRVLRITHTHTTFSESVAIICDSHTYASRDCAICTNIFSRVANFHNDFTTCAEMHFLRRDLHTLLFFLTISIAIAHIRNCFTRAQMLRKTFSDCGSDTCVFRVVQFAQACFWKFANFQEYVLDRSKHLP